MTASSLKSPIKKKSINLFEAFLEMLDKPDSSSHSESEDTSHTYLVSCQLDHKQPIGVGEHNKNDFQFLLLVL